VRAVLVRRVMSVACAVIGVVGLVLVGSAAPASAAPSASHPGHGGGGGGGGGGGQGGGGTATQTPSAGNDVSYPQCGTTLPGAPAFGIVGLNGGLANNLNPCFGPSSSYGSYLQSELYWAVAQSTGASTQPKASVYVNTADPGNFYGQTPIADWPTSGTNTDGTCTTTVVTKRHRTFTVGADSAACAWQYGYEKAIQDAAWLSQAATAIDGQSPPNKVPTTASSYPWWLDVETGNTWQSGTTGIAMNVADLQGMVAALRSAGASVVGVYSTASQWSQIAGTTTTASGSLYELPDWIPGATSLTAAKASCSLSSFTAGTIVLTQWTGTVDDDHAC
jgi:hypothetical protein